MAAAQGGLQKRGDTVKIMKGIPMTKSISAREVISTSLPFAVILLLAAASSTLGQPQLPFERTEQREPCTDFQPLKKPLYGDLHVHPSFSFDAYISSLRRDPWDA
jgi:hypothetical protein